MIGLNVITMAMEYYMMPAVRETLNYNLINKLRAWQYLDLALNICNYCFTAIFLCEVALKIYALGLSRYFTDKYSFENYHISMEGSTKWLLEYHPSIGKYILFRWNQLDVGIALLSVIGIGLEEVEGQVGLGCSPIMFTRERSHCRHSSSTPP